jgi:hypothetical protein
MSRKPEKTAIFSSSPWCKFLVSCIVISWERKCKQMRWLVEHEICPCYGEVLLIFLCFWLRFCLPSHVFCLKMCLLLFFVILYWSTLVVENISLERIESHKILGLTIQNNLKWDLHISDQSIKKTTHLTGSQAQWSFTVPFATSIICTY